MGEGWGEGYLLKLIISFKACSVLFELCASILFFSSSIVVSSFFSTKFLSVFSKVSNAFDNNLKLPFSLERYRAKNLFSKFVSSLFKYLMSSRLFLYKFKKKNEKISIKTSKNARGKISISSWLISE